LSGFSQPEHTEQDDTFNERVWWLKCSWDYTFQMQYTIFFVISLTDYISDFKMYWSDTERQTRYEDVLIRHRKTDKVWKN
jgi:hypothetical protein